jgi:MFS family permease
MTAFANGLNDSAPGALIASIERYVDFSKTEITSLTVTDRDYNIAYGTVSIIFICNALGFIAAAFFINTLSTKIGRAKTLVIGQILLMLGYACIVITPPFPAVAAS